MQKLIKNRLLELGHESDWISHLDNIWLDPYLDEVNGYLIPVFFSGMVFKDRSEFLSFHVRQCDYILTIGKKLKPALDSVIKPWENVNRIYMGIFKIDGNRSRPCLIYTISSTRSAYSYQLSLCSDLELYQKDFVVGSRYKKSKRNFKL